MTWLDHDCVIVDGGLVSFSPDMKPDQFHQWLLQELGEDYKSDIDGLRSKPGIRISPRLYCTYYTLTESRINGKLFLMLPEREDLLDHLKLDGIFKILILDKVKEVKWSKLMTQIFTSPLLKCR